MRQEILATTALLFAFLILVAITNYLYKYQKWSPENSRKFIHVSGGILCMLGFGFIHSPRYVFILCLIAFGILLVTFLKKSMPSIHGTQRVSWGSIVFPIPVFVCFLASKEWGNGVFFYLPVSLLTISDTLAELGGNKWGDRTLSFFHKQKTLAGSVCFAVSAFIICFFLFLHFSTTSILPLIENSFLCMIVTTLAELTTLKGFDNLTVPGSALILLYLIV